MADFSTERLDPASRVPDLPGQQPRRERDSQSRRRPSPPPPAKAEPEPAQDPEAPPHQIDSLV